MPAAPRKPIFIGLAIVALCAAVPGAGAKAGPYLLIEADTGKVISQSDAGKPWYPASVTKLMTTYLAFKAMREKKVEGSTLLTISENALAQPPSKMGFPKGTEITLDNAIKILMVKSANDIAMVIAEGLGGGSAENFVQQMNVAAAQIGMTGTHFTNPHGLPDENQFTTARDMAILARELLREFPEYEIYFRIPALQLGKRILHNHNKLIDHYPGADGMKTGFICSSGFNVVATARRNEKRLIAVVFGATTSVRRAEQAARLFERGFGRNLTVASVLGKEPALIDTMTNIPGTPYDMREDMCGPKKKRNKPLSDSDFDDDDDDPEAEAAAESENQKPGAIKKVVALVKKPLLQDLPASMAPIRVYLGSSPTAQANAALEVKKKAAPQKTKQTKAKDAKDTKAAKSGTSKEKNTKGVAGEKSKSGSNKGADAGDDGNEAVAAAGENRQLASADASDMNLSLRGILDEADSGDTDMSEPVAAGMSSPAIALAVGGPLIAPDINSVVARAMDLPPEVPMPRPRPQIRH